MIQTCSFPLLRSLVDGQLSLSDAMGGCQLHVQQTVTLQFTSCLQGMYAILSVDSTAQQSVLELVLPHVAAFLPAQEGELPPLKLDQCAKLQVSSYACHGRADRAECPRGLVAPTCAKHRLLTRGGLPLSASTRGKSMVRMCQPNKSAWARPPGSGGLHCSSLPASPNTKVPHMVSRGHESWQQANGPPCQQLLCLSLHQ